MKNSILHKADSRGNANHGWLQSRHTFSFADYHNPERTHFGVLRVLNDDTVAAGMGFGKHPHENMEIISIPLEGDLEHKDSMGNSTLIKSGDIQVMSAGTGVAHSEYNKNTDAPVKFLQIWVFPDKRDVQPRYGQVTLNKNAMHNKLMNIVSPQGGGGSVWIQQKAWFHMAEFDAGTTINYTLKSKQNGVYIFVLKGEVKVDEQELATRDGYGVWNIESLNLKAEKNSKILMMEVPMNV
jgi:redox-sensitive bicupin YhaK (pirin superfamily)